MIPDYRRAGHGGASACRPGLGLSTEGRPFGQPVDRVRRDHRSRSRSAAPSSQPLSKRRAKLAEQKIRVSLEATRPSLRRSCRGRRPAPSPSAPRVRPADGDRLRGGAHRGVDCASQNDLLRRSNVCYRLTFSRITPWICCV